MKPSKTTLILPLLLITFGAGWLLTHLEVAPEIDWIWTLGLVGAGLLLLVVIGVDKFTAVCAPLLFASALLSVLYQLNKVSLGVAVPLSIILAGVLLLIARRPSIPTPSWFEDDTSKNDG